jgi:broad specificity phosphatase PhoE
LYFYKGKKMAITFNFVRHAESEQNALGSLIGGRSVEVPLTKKGESQATALGKYFVSKGIHFDEAYSSTAVRTQQTAQFCFNAMSSQLKWQSDEELLEQDQGDWEKKEKSLYQKPEIRINYKYNNWKFIPGDDIKGESQKQVGLRMTKWVEEIVSKQDTFCAERNIVVFTHGLSIKYLLAASFKDNPKWKRYKPELEEGDQIEEKAPKLCNAYKLPIDNTSITQIKYVEKKPFLLSCNDTPHLK